VVAQGSSAQVSSSGAATDLADLRAQELSGEGALPARADPSVPAPAPHLAESGEPPMWVPLEEAGTAGTVTGTAGTAGTAGTVADAPAGSAGARGAAGGGRLTCLVTQ